MYALFGVVGIIYPVALVAGGIFILSLIMFFVGVILDKEKIVWLFLDSLIYSGVLLAISIIVHHYLLYLDKHTIIIK